MVTGKLGRYEIRGVLGSGAMALVLDGWDPTIGRRAAIKTIRRDQLDGAEADEVVERFKREAQAAGRLSHPNIVSVYEYGEDQGIAYIAMEFITGQELRAYFDRNDRFPIPEAVRIMTQILAALDVAHRNGVVHRDIKPGNIYIVDDGNVKVADFGIARIESSNLTQAGMALGTPPYMSPEQFLGDTLDGRSDLFSAGVILYQFLTGERPFTGNQAATIMHSVLQVDPPEPSRLNAQVPPAFDAVLRKALAKRRDERYATGREFADALNAAARGAPEAVPVAAPPAGSMDATRVERMQASVRAMPSATGRMRLGTGVRVALGFGVFLGLAALAGVWVARQLPPSPSSAAAPKPVVAAPAPPKPAPPAAVAPKPFDPMDALERVFAGRDRDSPVTVVADKPRIRIGKERLRFRATSAKPGYLYVLMVGTDRTHLNLIFPNAIDSANAIKAGQELDLPRAGWAMTAAGPRGTNHFVALVSENPRDFSAAGLRKVDPFAEFALDAAAAVAASPEGAAAFAGKPVCPRPGECSARYGAAIFSIEEIE